MFFCTNTSWLFYISEYCTGVKELMKHLILLAFQLLLGAVATAQNTTTLIFLSKDGWTLQSYVIIDTTGKVYDSHSYCPTCPAPKKGCAKKPKNCPLPPKGYIEQAHTELDLPEGKQSKKYIITSIFTKGSLKASFATEMRLWRSSGAPPIMCSDEKILSKEKRMK